MDTPSSAIHKVTEYFERIGLEPDTAATYIELAKIGPCSALQLTKQTRISRTQIYRHLETLQEHGLVSSEQLSYGTLFRPLAIDNLEATLVAREAATTALRLDLAEMAATMRRLAGAPQTETTNVQHFYGLAGIKQANWNLTKADTEFFVFEVAHLNEHLDKAFARRHRERVIERKLVSHDLTNRPVITAKEIEPFEPSRTFCRYIDPAILAINYEVYLYNDIVTLLDYTPGAMHAIEIHNQTLHAMMQQIYNALWAMATPVEIK